MSEFHEFMKKMEEDCKKIKQITKELQQELDEISGKSCPDSARELLILNKRTVNRISKI